MLERGIVLLHRKLSRSLISLTLPIALFASGSGISPVQAAPKDPANSIVDGSIEGQQISEETLREAYDELLASDAERTHHVQDGERFVTFVLQQGIELTLPDFNAPRSFVSAGRYDGGFWIEFTSGEQSFVIGGAGTILASGICALLSLGNAACLVVGIAMHAASTYLDRNRECPNNSIRMFYNWAGQIQRTECQY
ncbi:hypothetical protein APT58_07880 [Corynebacterium glutamicum]|nr:hypothetical protein APT58_07880 [Corynebacterium glutamicum]